MKKNLMAGFALGLILAGTAAAQFVGSLYGRGPGSRTYGSPSGFGNILFPGTGTAPPLVSPHFHPGPSFGQRLSATITGRPSHLITGPLDPRRAYPVVIPYVVPVWTGYGYGLQAPGQNTVMVVNQPPAQPTVIINQYYRPETARGVVRDYTREELPEPAAPTMRSYQAPVPSHPEPAARAAEAKPTIYLIAFKNQSIYPALAYWVDGDTLNYITLQGSHNRASLELIDREFSEQLNRERGVEFNLAPR